MASHDGASAPLAPGDDTKSNQSSALQRLQIIKPLTFAGKIQGVSLEFLMDWAADYLRLSTAEVCARLADKTDIGNEGCSYLELLSKTNPEHVGDAMLYLCHPWQSKFHSTITAIQNYFTNDATVQAAHTFIWIDIVCVNQHAIRRAGLNEKSARFVAEDVRIITSLVDRTMVVIDTWRGYVDKDTLDSLMSGQGADEPSDDEDDDDDDEMGDDSDPLMILQRAWCVWEMLCTAPDDLFVGMTHSEKHKFLRELENQPLKVIGAFADKRFQSNLSEASLDSDVEVLHNLFQTCVPEGFPQVDGAIRAHFYRFVAESAWGLLVDKQRIIEREYGLPAAEAAAAEASAAEAKSTAQKAKLVARRSSSSMSSSSSMKRKSLRNLLRTQAILLRDLGDAFKAHGLGSYAIEVFKGVLKMHERYAGENQDYDRIRAINFSNLADILSDARKYEEAVKFYKHALEINRKLEPTLVPDTLNGIANNLWLLNRQQEAEELFLEIIELDRASAERETSSRTKRCLATSLLNMGNHLESTSPARAMPYLSEAVELSVSLFPEDESEDTLVELRSLAKLCLGQKDFGQAAKHFELLLTLRGICERDAGDGESGKLGVFMGAEDAASDSVSARAARAQLLLADDLYALGTCLLQDTSSAQAWQDAAVCLRAALDLHTRNLVRVSKGLQQAGEVNTFHNYVVRDLHTLADIESKRGNTKRATGLSARAAALVTDLVKAEFRKGPLAELEFEHCERKEAQVPAMLAALENGNLDPGKRYALFDETCSDLERLSAYHWIRRDYVRSVSLLCEATKVRLFWTGQLSQKGPAWEWKMLSVKRQARQDLVQLFQLFGQVAGLQPLDPAFATHCANFVKMAVYFYKDDESSDSVALALNLHGRLLGRLGRKGEAVEVLKEAVRQASKVYREPNLPWIGILSNATNAIKAIGDLRTCLVLQTRICDMYEQFLGDKPLDEQAASNLYQVAITSAAYAEQLDENGKVEQSVTEKSSQNNDGGGEPSKQALLATARRSLARGILILEGLDDNGDQIHLVIMRRELRSLSIAAEDWEEALRQAKLISLVTRHMPKEPMAEEDLKLLRLLQRKVGEQESSSSLEEEGREGEEEKEDAQPVPEDEPAESCLNSNSGDDDETQVANTFSSTLEQVIEEEEDTNGRHGTRAGAAKNSNMAKAVQANKAQPPELPVGSATARAQEAKSSGCCILQ